MDDQDQTANTEPNIPLSTEAAPLPATGASDWTTEASSETTAHAVQEPNEPVHAASGEDTMPAQLPERSLDTPPLSAAPVTPMVPLPYPPVPAPPATPVIPPPALPSSAYAPPPSFSQPLYPSQPLGPYAAPPPRGYVVPPAPGSAPLLPPAPNYYGGYQQPGVPVMMGRPENPSRIAAIITEVILNMFGIYGIGWLIAGEMPVGIILLIASFIWWPIAALGIFFTAGLGALCVLPLNVIFLLISVITLAQRTAARAY